ncbi:MAG TPA: long-chain-fatty-acid--CoA ligase [Steroidobacteraceae bacterium]|nr:long-chain-fatty-acid--CoA ligase [Steroidobacteraceae bacterium]
MQQPGRMMDRPLLISTILEHAEAQHGQAEIVSRETHGPVFRYSFAECAVRVRKLANALGALGLPAGAGVGSIAWNNHRHVELYYAVSGGGMVIHTCNPRLHLEQLIYIINHAEDRLIFFDTSFAPLVEKIAEHCPKIGAWICMTDAQNMPVLPGVANLHCYETLIAAQRDEFRWPQFDERASAAICYTSGTTGNPKGVLYSHRAIVLNGMSICMPGMLGLSPRESMLPVVPMFHINGWCAPYGCLIGGAKLVLPGPRLDGAGLHELMESEQVTVSAGVPTVWLGLLHYVEQNELKFSSLRRVLSGGSAVPLTMIAKFDEQYGIEIRQGWGMTETTAAATISCLTKQQLLEPPARRHQDAANCGKSVFGVDIKIVAEDGSDLPRDGKSQGELMVRGQWIVSGYFKDEVSALRDGWFPTGDIATIDPRGVLQIRDRAKDLIKTGGEWISSIDLENFCIAHPAVAAAAVIGVKHPKWQERPLLFVVRKPGAILESADILAFLAERVAKWWVPEDVIFLESLPVGGTGKVQKVLLREKYGNLFD